MHKEVLLLIWSPPLALLTSVYFVMESLALLPHERVFSFVFFLLACIALVAFIFLQKQLYELLTIQSPKPPGSRKSIPRPKAGGFTYPPQAKLAADISFIVRSWGAVYNCGC